MRTVTCYLISYMLIISGLLYGLIRLEQDAPLQHKPSIILRVFTGELPSGNLDAELKTLENATAKAAAATESIHNTLAELQTANRELDNTYSLLEHRVKQQHARVWSIPYQPY